MRDDHRNTETQKRQKRRGAEEEKVKRVVKDLTRGGAVAVVAGALTAAFVSHAAAKEPVGTVTASELRLVDAEGRERITMSVVDGVATISLYDENGRVGCRIAAGDRGSGVGVFAKGKIAVELFQRTDGPPPGPRVPHVGSLRGLMCFDDDEPHKKRIVLTTVESNAGLRINGDDAGATIGVHAVRDQGPAAAEIRAWARKEGHDFRLSLPSTEEEAPIARLILDRRVRWSPAK
jgi:hypothetical protein